MDKNYSLKESEKYFRALEGKLRSPLFGKELAFVAKGCDDVYAVRCAEYFEGITPENLAEHTAFHKALSALVEYLADLLDEDDYDIGDVDFDEDSTVEDLLKLVEPTALVFEKLGLLSDDECPVAFSLKLGFLPVPDESMEIALHGDEAIYAGEFSGVSPWNDKLLKKKWNYLR